MIWTHWKSTKNLDSPTKNKPHTLESITTKKTQSFSSTDCIALINLKWLKKYPRCESLSAKREKKEQARKFIRAAQS